MTRTDTYIVLVVGVKVTRDGKEAVEKFIKPGQYIYQDKLSANLAIKEIEGLGYEVKLCKLMKPGGI